MKKLMAVLAAIMVLVPISVKADTYATYNAGEEVNFYAYDEDTQGHMSIILEDKGSEEQYVKAWFTGIIGTGQDVYADVALQQNVNAFENTGAYKTLLDHLNTHVYGFSGHALDINQAGNLQLITLQELISVFGATQSGEIYTIDMNKWGPYFTKVVTSANGLMTQTVEGDSVWVVKFARDPNTTALTGLTVEKVPWATTTFNDYALSPVVYVDKTYDCLERTLNTDYACYKCDEEYTWVAVGEAAETCELVPDITTKSKCVVSPETGLEEYLLEFIAVVGVCGLALIIAKRKDLFRSI